MAEIGNGQSKLLASGQAKSNYADLGNPVAHNLCVQVREALLQALAAEGEITFKDLKGAVLKRTPADLWERASPGWYTTTVKLDLEARGLISRHGSPQMLRLTEKGKRGLGKKQSP